ncbi:MAG: hypothetical protein A3J07_01160 [Candidatus Doudnabacteria bacterium RIFCSPLOWO2_02_FULL_49_13]|uniref:Uncharacterized protein n=1 Tax=Candidatus Doudnabacteria bacterium RIFCSPHIGHO2_12_FULL_48_16 TaxID=1817838 RepID=A0A1F5PKG1_9BACT|nr:MAG: hypothetical protein A3B77_04090 [Candidatus Doudnabacteria bacterium RIFCSPHIGHO2_02_FULL_49_24]OGE88664.1 MAG: hypothetical protein A2760_01750 [Candidatus Doudnabacteria bacterium RIFCSPHIGHO2_01_FULL_50_67]OGE90349.1 MAG: hypothetical protein A3E29_04670 [Candidatus Doudnabacteria bacterium RIFCSPHIGHO2_12_FULL_48_16]OGE97056.1 MAG: hypothetical protein A2990_01660 [Candidatus Doudnabacteria bacterium RIFCSPLOWO2_01_FULL_49_40]OGF02405.1 MAG: hypothetical protein A3J07_01160 [Candid
MIEWGPGRVARLALSFLEVQLKRIITLTDEDIPSWAIRNLSPEAREKLLDYVQLILRKMDLEGQQLNDYKVRSLIGDLFGAAEIVDNFYQSKSQ